MVTIFQIAYQFYSHKEGGDTLAITEGRLLNDFMMIHRKYYQKLFIDEVLTLNEKTLPALPAFSASIISETFTKNNKSKIIVRTVSDRARNPKNMADRHEMDAIAFFKANSDKTEYFKPIKEDNFSQYATVLKITKNCLKCHGEKEDAPAFISQKYKQSYGYEIGEVRGIISVKIPKKHIQEYTMKSFYSNLFYGLLIIVGIFASLLWMLLKDKEEYEKIKKQKNELAYKKNLAEKEVVRRIGFIKNISHELRTPLNSIINFTEQVEEDLDELAHDEKLRELSKDSLRRVLKNSADLLRVINDTIEYSKAESGELLLDIYAQDIIPMLRRVYSDIEVLNTKKGIDLRLKLEDTLLASEVDSIYFTKIIKILLTNAIKQTEDGFIELRSYKQNKEIVVEIEDSGTGFSKEYQETIFKPFENESSHKLELELELGIVKQLCKAMDIEISLYSEVTKGTIFKLILKKDTYES